MNIIELENQEYRRDIIALLEQDSDYAMSELILKKAVQALGNPIAKDRLRSQLQWLKEQALITVSILVDTDLHTAKLTYLGEDVANGRATVPGIARKPLD
jgi:hypothetical protein